MKKNAIIFILVVIGVISFSFRSEKDLTPVVYAFNRSGLKLEEVHIKGWVKLDDSCREKDDFESIARSIYNFFGIEFITEDIKKDELNKKVDLKKEYAEGYIYISVENIHYISSGNYESIASVDVTQCGNLLNINNIREKVFDSLYEIGKNPCVDICVTGCAEGILDQSEREKLLGSILDDLNVVTAETVKDNNIISICGYTRDIDDFIETGSRKININVASRVSQSARKTYFWLGTPLINMEY